MSDTQNHTAGWHKRKLLFLFLIPAFLLVMAAVVQFLWNAILPAIAHAGVISYWQSLGLLALCRILFGGFGFGGHKPPFGRTSPMKQKWLEMNDEEKQKFREEWKWRCQHRSQ